MKKQLSALTLFSVAFAYVESAVVYYLQKISSQIPKTNVNYKIILNLKAIVFVVTKNPILGNSAINHVEIIREFSTILMLIGVSFLSGRTLKERLGAFLIAFSLWDIFYYVFLKILTGWPKSLLDIDVFFLIPIPWIGPVVTPLVISVILLILGLTLFLNKEHLSSKYFPS
jgi:hypothetical protein